MSRICSPAAIGPPISSRDHSWKHRSAAASISGDGELGYIGEAEIQGFANSPFPISVYGTLQWETTPQGRALDGITGNFSAETELLGGNGYLTATPTPDDRFVFYTKLRSATIFRWTQVC